MQLVRGQTTRIRRSNAGLLPELPALDRLDTAGILCLAQFYSLSIKHAEASVHDAPVWLSYLVSLTNEQTIVKMDCKSAFPVTVLRFQAPERILWHLSVLWRFVLVSSPSFYEMRKRNMGDVLDFVRKNHGISRAELAKETCLAKATVSAIVDDLISKRVLIEVGVKASNGGRPAVGLAFNPSYGYVFGVSLDESEISACLLDLNGEVQKQFGRKIDGSWNSAKIWEFLIEQLRKSLRGLGSDLNRVFGAGVAVPGPVISLSEGEFSSNVSDFDKVSQYLAAALGCRPVVDSNTNMAAIAEITNSELPDSQLVFVVRIGSRVRSALVAGGNILGGSGGLAGELGHIALPGNKRLCSCGARGCINTIASTAAMLQSAQLAGLKVKTMQDLLELAHFDNQDVQGIFMEAGKAIGFGVSQVINLVAPHVVIVAGPATNQEGLLMRSLQKKINKFAILENRTNCHIIPGSVSGKSECLGAGMVALKRLEISETCISQERLAAV